MSYQAAAAHDPITGFLSRRGGLQAAEYLVCEAATGNRPLAAMWINLDRFQQINQSFGHLNGDSVIERVANRIRSTIKIRCELSRMGGDEFLCMLPGLDLPGARQLAGELLQAIEAPLPIADILFRPTASIGVAAYQTDEDHLTWLEHADRALIEAKRQGGRRIIVSGEEPVPGRLGVLLAREELSIESELHLALETGGLQLNFQPILRRDGSIEAVEALMRCNANGRQISPAQFIPVAEKTGLIIRLGEWCLLQGGECATRLHEEGLSAKVAINVSRAQLISPKFIQALNGALICANVEPQRIELELTESLFMDFSDVVQGNLRSARDIGVGLAIDDFGTGYSCLANLKDLPATKLKLDRAFVAVLPNDGRAFSVVKAMTKLGQELGMTVVAEGVETQGQADALADAGVDAFQGYFYARPMAEDALIGWIKQGRSK